MKMVYLFHIVAGTLGLLSGYLALYSSKGAPMHRRAGMVFVYTMVTMCLFGGIMAAIHKVWAAVNISAAVITAYLVITGLMTMRPPKPGRRWLHVSLMLVALGVGLTDLTFGIEAINSPNGRRLGVPPFPYFLFGFIGTLAGVLDLRVMLAGPLTGPSRLTRHLWRMTTALLIAAMSFFLGQADVFPKSMRIMPVLAIPVMAVLVTLFYWLWRIRIRRSLRGLTAVRAPLSA